MSSYGGAEFSLVRVSPSGCMGAGSSGGRWIVVDVGTRGSVSGQRIVRATPMGRGQSLWKGTGHGVMFDRVARCPGGAVSRRHPTTAGGEVRAASAGESSGAPPPVPVIFGGCRTHHLRVRIGDSSGAGDIAERSRVDHLRDRRLYRSRNSGSCLQRCRDLHEPCGLHESLNRHGRHHGVSHRGSSGVTDRILNGLGSRRHRGEDI